LTAYRKLQASRQGVFVIIGATISEQQAPYGKPNKLAPLGEALVALEMAEDKLFKLSRAKGTLYHCLFSRTS